MNAAMSGLRERMIGWPVYRGLRFGYQTLFDQQAVDRRRRRCQFYSALLMPNDLVFDVGANLGNYAESLCQVGARVIAIEPDPRNVEILRRRLKSKRVHIESCAVGSQAGTAELHMAAYAGEVSTLSPDWADSANCGQKMSVRVVTLDAVAAKYGMPRYVKIDTEGYDAEVLRGMSFRPPLLSFEFVPARLSVARDCAGILEGFQFNWIAEENSRLELEHWVGKDEILNCLTSLPAHILYGDVFARLPQSFMA